MSLTVLCVIIPDSVGIYDFRNEIQIILSISVGPHKSLLISSVSEEFRFQYYPLLLRKETNWSQKGKVKLHNIHINRGK